jgi:para-aminobenzoate synthetase component 1
MAAEVKFISLQEHKNTLMLNLPPDKMEMMDNLGSRGIPFLFAVSFDGSEVFVWKHDEIPSGVKFSVPLLKQNRRKKTDYRKGTFTTGHQATVPRSKPGGIGKFDLTPVEFERYNKAFEKVMVHLKRGDTYLINLTMPTAIDSPLTLQEIFDLSDSPYKLLISERFVCFSPEIFVRITDGIISSFPMKGTIDATAPGAEKIILADKKELAEHNTIVDLIRNDLSMVAKEVRVKRYRYIDRIETNRGPLLQVSSEITGVMEDHMSGKIGTLMSRLLPAGSVTGAPKEKTVEIIAEAEGYDRGFYTGVFGWFDGKDLDCGVMIRFVESHNGKLIYKSGGGITALSVPESEYSELVRKVYVPVKG